MALGTREQARVDAERARTTLDEKREIRGRRLDTNLGPSILNPGSGKHARRVGRPVYCGAIAGRCFGYVEHPNSRDVSKINYRFVGEFIGIKADGGMVNTAEAYLPGSMTRSIKAALDIAKGHLPDPITFSIEVWAEPDDRESSTIGYKYVCYDVKPQGGESPLLSLAYASGLLEAPQQTLPSNVDPDTGEINADDGVE